MVVTGSSIKDVHTKGGYVKSGHWTNVEMGYHYLSYSGRPQALPLFMLTFVTIYSCLTLLVREMTDVCTTSKIQHA